MDGSVMLPMKLRKTRNIFRRKLVNRKLSQMYVFFKTFFLYSGDAAEFVNQSCHDAADYVRGCPHEAVEKGSDEVDNAEKGKATFNESAGEYKMVPENQAQKVADAITGPSSEPEAHGWFDNMTEEVKEDAKYLQKKAGKQEFNSNVKSC